MACRELSCIRVICVHQNKVRDRSHREANPLLLATNGEELHVIDSNAAKDKTDVEISTFRYIY